MQGTEEDEENYPKGWKLALIFMALCLGVFLTSLDNSILATAIPKITDTFQSLDDVSWYASAYSSLAALFSRPFAESTPSFFRKVDISHCAGRF